MYIITCNTSNCRQPSVRSHGILAKIHGKFLDSLGKDAMAMQDRAKANHHDLGKDAMINHVRDKDAMINHVLDKGSMVPNPFFLVTPSVRNHGIPANSCSRSPL